MVVAIREILYKVLLILVIAYSNFAYEILDLSFRKDLNYGDEKDPNLLRCSSNQVLSEEILECCKIGDTCLDFILSGETAFNLTNDTPVKILSCECEEMFRKCLRTVNTGQALMIENRYFRKTYSKCFKLAFPVIRCKTYRLADRYRLKQCVQYLYNTTQPKVNQFFFVSPF